jgi:hypothetical protein
MRSTILLTTLLGVMLSIPVSSAGGKRRAVEQRLPDKLVEAVVTCERHGFSDCSDPGRATPDSSLQAPPQIVRALIVNSEPNRLHVILPSTPSLIIPRTAHGYRNHQIRPFTIREITEEASRKDAMVLHYFVSWRSRSEAEVFVTRQSPVDFTPDPSFVRVAGCGEIRYFIVRKGSRWTCRRSSDDEK